MIDRSALEDSLYAWADAVLSVPVIFAEQGGPRPSVPYITIKVRAPTMTGPLEEAPPDSNRDQETRIYYEVPVSIQLFGSGAMDRATKLQFSLGKSADGPGYTLSQAGLSHLRTDGMDDITELVDTEWEERVSLDLIFMHQATETDAVDTIEHVNNADGTIKGSITSPNKIDLDVN